jgi:hypothetical protein
LLQVVYEEQMPTALLQNPEKQSYAVEQEYPSQKETSPELTVLSQEGGEHSLIALL